MELFKQIVVSVKEAAVDLAARAILLGAYIGELDLPEVPTAYSCALTGVRRQSGWSAVYQSEVRDLG